jgi:hypothetical protein
MIPRTLGYYAKGKPLGLRHRFLGSCVVRKNTWQFRARGEPTAALLLLVLDSEFHRLTQNNDSIL